MLLILAKVRKGFELRVSGLKFRVLDWKLEEVDKIISTFENKNF
jgi:hypothetical protein